MVIDVRLVLLLLALGVLVVVFASPFAGGVIVAVAVVLLVLDILRRGRA